MTDIDELREEFKTMLAIHQKDGSRLGAVAAQIYQILIDADVDWVFDPDQKFLALVSNTNPQEYYYL
jgi:hypothetical protein